MNRYILELLLIAEAGKIDKYVKYRTKTLPEIQSGDYLEDVFVWGHTDEGHSFWEKIHTAAYNMSALGLDYPLFFRT